MTAVLVTGGAGYIGAHAVLALQEAGYTPVVVDNFSTGDPAMVAAGVPCLEISVADRAAVAGIIRQYGCQAVIHFAGSIVVGESVVQPLAYYGNNTAATLALLEACVASGVKTVLFSSTAAVYGIPDQVPVAEDAPTRPINPYGWSKIASEQILQDAARAHGLRYGILRYFNVAGADPQGRCGQLGKKATHLIKIACELVAGKREEMVIYGDDYPTPDGTCVRDYIHVSDLAEAHVLLLKALERGAPSSLYNCGYGVGYSVHEVLAAVERVAGRALPVTIGPRRPGDPPVLVADSRKLQQDLAWRPRYQDLQQIIRDALAWEVARGRCAA